MVLLGRFEKDFIRPREKSSPPREDQSKRVRVPKRLRESTTNYAEGLTITNVHNKAIVITE